MSDETTGLRGRKVLNPANPAVFQFLRRRQQKAPTAVVPGTEIMDGFKAAISVDSVHDRALLAYLSNLGDVVKAASYLGIEVQDLERQVEAVRLILDRLSG